ncbi:MAG: ABC transporter substrate-binding protein [Planctomycetes bacterium]|nr:ABC transporter substrate-binding protein [Planctomycetota bacterium]
MTIQPRGDGRRAVRRALVLTIVGSGLAACGDGTTNTVRRVAEPRRIVALTIGSVDTLSMLGELRRAVAVEEDCHVPGTEGLVRIRNDDHSGPSQALNVEAVIDLQPDLVIAKHDLRPALDGRGLDVLWVPTGSDLDTIAATVVDIGERIGRGDKARATVQAMRAQVARLRQRTADLPRVAVYYEAGRPGRSAGKGTVIDDMISLAGGRNIAGDIAMANPTLSAEAILAADPEVILLSPWCEAPDAIAARPGWDHIAAVKAGRVYRIPEAQRQVQSPSPACIAACERQLLPWLHPELFADGARER